MKRYRRMNEEQVKIIKDGKGFIAALDQSGGSTPKALKLYGVEENEYNGEDEMFGKIHEMRTRIIKSPAFSKDRILGAILFEQTMDSDIDGKKTADYLWEEKGVVPFLKVDKGLADLKDGVQLMKEMPELDSLLDRAVKAHIFGTKMRSVIKEYNEEAIKEVVKQQFEVAEKIMAKGLVPIIEPEVDIHAKDKEKIEEYLKKCILEELNKLSGDKLVMLKLTIPTKDGLYSDLMENPHVLRVVALSGGYTREDSNEKLKKNPGLIASFSRALSEGLNAKQTDEEFNKMLQDSADSIYEASII